MHARVHHCPWLKVIHGIRTIRLIPTNCRLKFHPPRIPFPVEMFFMSFAAFYREHRSASTSILIILNSQLRELFQMPVILTKSPGISYYTPLFSWNTYAFFANIVIIIQLITPLQIRLLSTSLNTRQSSVFASKHSSLLFWILFSLFDQSSRGNERCINISIFQFGSIITLSRTIIFCSHSRT